MCIGTKHLCMLNVIPRASARVFGVQWGEPPPTSLPHAHARTHLDGALDGPGLDVKEEQPPVLAPAGHSPAVMGDGDTEHTASVPLEGARGGEERGAERAAMRVHTSMDPRDIVCVRVCMGAEDTMLSVGRQKNLCSLTVTPLGCDGACIAAVPMELAAYPTGRPPRGTSPRLPSLFCPPIPPSCRSFPHLPSPPSCGAALLGPGPKGTPVRPRRR